MEGGRRGREASSRGCGAAGRGRRRSGDAATTRAACCGSSGGGGRATLGSASAVCNRPRDPWGVAPVAARPP